MFEQLSPEQHAKGTKFPLCCSRELVIRRCKWLPRKYYCSNLTTADLCRGTHAVGLNPYLFDSIIKTDLYFKSNTPKHILQISPRLHCWKIRLQTKNAATVECINICIIHVLDQISKLLKDCSITYNILCVYMDQLEQSNGDNFCCLLLIFMTTKSTTQKSIVKVDSHVFNIKSFSRIWSTISHDNDISFLLTCTGRYWAFKSLETPPPLFLFK